MKENSIKKYAILFVLFISFIFIPHFSFAWWMMDFGNAQDDGNSENSKTKEDETAGASVWQNLQNKQTSCDKLNDDDFEKLGDYFMGQMTGSSHSAMDDRMERMMGESALEQMHIVLGKRLSGCDASAQFVYQGQGFMPMMYVNNNSGYGFMMNYGFSPFFWVGWIFMIVLWVLLILAIFLFIKWLFSLFFSRGGASNSALNILKERYAKGEIDKKEFEEKKKELS